MFKVIVPVSGGKDSQTCLKLAIEKYGSDSVLGLFCDTGFEHPLTYQHIEDMKKRYNVDIHTIKAGDVEGMVRRFGRFPAGGRHCTVNLKMRPSKKFYKHMAQSLGHGFEVWYGVRSSESAERAKRYIGKVSDEVYAPHDFISDYPKYLEKMGVMFRLPIVDWSTEDVLGYLEGEQNPLYSQGFDRVGCFPCLASGDKWKEKAFNHDDFGKSQYAIVQVLEKEIGKSVWTSKGGKARNCSDGSGCSICSM